MRMTYYNPILHMDIVAWLPAAACATLKPDEILPDNCLVDRVFGGLWRSALEQPLSGL